MFSLQSKGLLDILGDGDFTVPAPSQGSKPDTMSSGGELLDLLGGLDLSAPAPQQPMQPGGGLPSMQPVVNSVPNLMDGLDALQPMNTTLTPASINQNTDLLGGLTNNIGMYVNKEVLVVKGVGSGMQPAVNSVHNLIDDGLDALQPMNTTLTPTSINQNADLLG